MLSLPNAMIGNSNVNTSIQPQDLIRWTKDQPLSQVVEIIQSQIGNDDSAWIEAMQDVLSSVEGTQDARQLVYCNNARLCAKGYAQEEGYLSFGRIIAPVARLEGFCLVRIFVEMTAHQFFSNLPVGRETVNKVSQPGCQRSRTLKIMASTTTNTVVLRISPVSIEISCIPCSTPDQHIHYSVSFHQKNSFQYLVRRIRYEMFDSSRTGGSDKDLLVPSSTSTLLHLF
ncbi:hypothetical protein Tco_0524591 [Tanacetum coccineum]